VLIELRIPCLTVYALSLENISNRSPEEVNQLFELIAMGLDELRRSADICNYDIRVNIAGARATLPHRLRQAADAVEEETKMRGAGGLLTICLAYGGRQDLVLSPSLPPSLPPPLPPSLSPLVCVATFSM
jgi:undecaprenyl diphosphate synthase